MLLSLVPGKYVAVNYIIIKLTFKKWRANIDFYEDLLVSRKLNTNSALKYRITKSGMTVNVKFKSKYFSDPLIQHKKGNI